MFICHTKTESANTWDHVPSGDEPAQTASEVSYANGTSGLSATDVQGAIDEVVADMNNIAAADISFDNEGSELESEDVQNVILELDHIIDENQQEIYNRLYYIGTESNEWVASFSDGGDNIPVEECEVRIENTQNLNGYDRPWLPGCNKNLLPFFTNGSSAGVTYTVSSTGVITATGKATGNSRIFQYLDLPAGDYVLSGAAEGSTVGVGDMYVTVMSSGTVVARDYTGIEDSGRKFTLTQTENLYVACRFTNAATSSTATKIFKPQIERGTDTTSYSPNQNICPITGVSSVSITVCGKNIYDQTAGTSGAYINSDGGITSHSSWSISDYIKINGNMSWRGAVTGFGTNPRSAYYDASKNFISVVKLSGETGTIEPPDGAKYIRISVRVSDQPTFQVEYGNLSSPLYYSYNGVVYTVSLGETLYDDVVDLSDGSGSSSYNIVDMGNLNYTYDSTYHRMYTDDLTDIIVAGTRRTKFLCECFYAVTDGRSLSDVPDCSIYTGNPGTIRVYLQVSTYTDPAVFKSDMTGKLLVYPVTPRSFTFTKEKVYTLSTDNNIFADCGRIKRLIYFNKWANMAARLIKAFIS